MVIPKVLHIYTYKLRKKSLLNLNFDSYKLDDHGFIKKNVTDVL